MAPDPSDRSEIRTGSPDRTDGIDGRRSTPAAERNISPISSVLGSVLPDRGHVLEIASGTGTHAAAFARAFPALTWQPSDLEDEALQSIRAWRKEAALDNLLEPLRLDVDEPDWPARFEVGHFDAALAINLVHIAPWNTAVGLIAGATRVLAPRGVLYLYGPFAIKGRHTAPSNAEFDRWLKARSPAWGVRDLDDIEKLGAEHGFTLEQRLDMPANNMSLILRKH